MGNTMIYTVSITSKGQMTLPKPVRDELGLKTPGEVTLKVSKGGRLAIQKPVAIEDIHTLLGKPTGRAELTEREKTIAPQALKKYERHAKKSSRR
jgi:antitoxin PrlF